MVETSKSATVYVRIGEEVTVEEVSGLVATAQGWLAQVEDGESVVFRVIGADATSNELITGVRSQTLSNEPSISHSVWSREGDSYISPVFRSGDQFSIEIDNSTHSDPVPRGGQYFVVVEEGGG